MRIRRYSVLGALLVVALGGCGSPKPGPSPSPSAWIARSLNASPLLVQCALNAGIPQVVTTVQQANAALPPEQQWVHAGRIELTPQNGSVFNGAYEGHLAGVVIDGMALDRWEIWAGQHDMLPPQLCGTGISPRELYDLIYDKYPALRAQNPWN